MDRLPLLFDLWPEVGAALPSGPRPVAVWSPASTDDAVAIVLAAAEHDGPEVVVHLGTTAGETTPEPGISLSDAAFERFPDRVRERWFTRRDRRWMLSPELSRRIVATPPEGAIDLLLMRCDETGRAIGVDRRVDRRVPYLSDGGRVFVVDGELRRSAFALRPVSHRAPLYAPGDDGPAEPAALAGFEALPTAAVVVAADGTAVAVNAAARELLGIGSFMPGRSFRSLSPTLDWNRVWRLVETGPTDGPAAVSADLGGGRRDLEVTVAPAGEAGSVVTIVDAAATVDLRRQLAEAARTLRAAHAQLRAAYEELRRTNAEFAQVVSELESATDKLVELRRPDTAAG